MATKKTDGRGSSRGGGIRRTNGDNGRRMKGSGARRANTDGRRGQQPKGHAVAQRGTGTARRSGGAVKRKRKGRVSRAVYIRRRIVMAIAALIALVLAVFCVVSLVRGGMMIHQNMAAGDTSATRSSVPEPKQTSNVPGCSKDDIQLTLTPDTTTVGVGGTVTFTAKITYTGSSAEGCFVDGEDDNRVLSITSGNDTIWRSDACESTYRPLLMYAGATDEQQITWNTNATGDSCVADSDLPHVEAGTYVAKLSLRNDETVQSAPVTIMVQ